VCSNKSNAVSLSSPARSLLPLLSSFLPARKTARDRGFNKARSVNDADATALELIYTRRKRHGHAGKA